MPTDHLIFLAGTIPESLAKLGELEHLNLGSNQLSGHFFILFCWSVPTDQLFFNYFLVPFIGGIPESFGQLGNLVELNLSRNKLKGQFFSIFEAVSAD